MKAAVIGGGIGGLAVGALLSSDGNEVTIYEKNNSVGGKMNEIRAKGFRFDTGPSLLTMPELLEQLFDRCGEKLDDYLQLEPLDPLCRYFYPDGTVFDNYSSKEKSEAEIHRIAPEDVQSYEAFLTYATRLYEKTAPSFLFNPLFDLLDLKNLNFWDLTGIDAMSTVSNRVNEHFQSSYLRRFFKRFATYNGSSPFQAPATLNVIPHVEINCGGYYIKGGLYRLALALRQLAEQNGSNIILNTEVDHILTQRGRVNGIRLTDGTEKGYELVVSNSDAYQTYLNLLSDNDVSSIRQKIISCTEPSCSGFVLLLGIDRTYVQLRHHNVFFSDDYEEEFRTIFKEKVPYEDPTIYIANTSYADRGHAPQGGSNLFVLVNAPYLSPVVDWQTQEATYADLIKQKLESRGLGGLRASVEYEEHITPLDFFKKYRSNRGSIYGTSSNSRMAAFMRPGNKVRSVEGLYLVGGSTHPGGGIPLVLLSAKHAYTLIKRYEIQDEA